MEKLEAVELRLGHNVAPTVLVEILAGSNPNTGALLASEMIAVGSSLATYRIEFSTPPTIIAGSPFIIAITDQNAPGNLRAETSTNSTYPGRFSEHNNTGWQAPLFTEDLYFETFVTGRNSTVYLDSMGLAVIDISDIDAGSFDNCGIDSLWIDIDTVDCDDIGEIDITLMARDIHGESSECEIEIIIADTIGEVFVNCPSAIVLPNNQGSCGRMVGWNPPVAFDNCGVDSVTSTHVPAQFFPVDSTTVKYVAYFSSGVQDTCVFEVIVQDEDPPVLSGCPTLTTSVNDSGMCGAIINWTPPSAVDNCTGSTLTSNFSPGAFFQVGSTSVAYIASDSVGNIDSCTFLVTVLDQEAPEIICPSGITVGSDAGNCGALVNYSTPSGTDNCTGLSTSLLGGVGSGGVFPVGTSLETYLVTDQGGLMDSCSFTVTVLDDDDPVFFSCPTGITALNDTGQCSAVVNYALPGANDNCTGVLVNLTTGLGSGATFSIGSHTEVYTATDTAGNSAVCTFTVTVSDAEAPVIVCPPNIITGNDSAICAAFISYIDPIGTDNCSGVSTVRTTGNAPNTLFLVGVDSVTFTSTDSAGNSSSCTFTVTVNDTDPPTINCPAPLTVFNDQGACSATVSYATPVIIDNCTGTNLSLLNGQGIGGVFPVGQSIETYQVTDISGNTDTCSFVVTVLDGENPVANCPASFVVANDTGQCAGIVSYTPPGGIDNCAIDSVMHVSGLGSGALFPLGASVETWAVSDVAGNRDTCSFSITVVDAEAPVALCHNITVALDSIGGYTITPAEINNGSTDNCGIDSMIVLGDELDCFDLGNNVLTLMVLDRAGNSQTCTATVQVLDSLLPEIVCLDTTLYLNATGTASVQAADISPGAYDNCFVVSLVLNQNNFNCTHIGTNTVTVTAADPSFNTVSCTAQITILDSIAPVAVCTDTTLSLDGQGVLTVDPAALDGGSLDACSIDSMWVDTALFDCQQLGVHTLTLSMQDPVGNLSTCTSQVTIVDAVAPIASCKDTTLFLDSIGRANIAVGDLDNGSSDNCGIGLLAASQSVFGCQNLGLNTVTVTVTDININVSTCLSQVTIIDSTLPTIVGCPGDTIVVVDSVNCNPAVSWIPPAANDNCGIVTFSSSSLPNDTFPVGLTSILYTAVDPAGNTQFCEFKINVQPTQFRANVSGILFPCGFNLSCNGATDGSGIVSLSGGCAPYSYLWDTGDTIPSVTNLGVGWHSVTVTDARGIALSDSILITEPPLLFTQFSGNLDLCTTDSTGIIDLTVIGGATCSSLSYQWSNGDTIEDLINVPGGTYFVDVADANGCIITDTVTLNLFAPAVVDLGADTSVCPNQGYILDPGAGFLSVFWSTGDTTPTINVDTVGTFSVEVTNTNGCTGADTVQIGQYMSPQVFLGNDTTLCFGDSLFLDAGANFEAYLWSVGGTTQTHTVANGGLTWVEVTDSNACKNRDSISLGVIFATNPNIQSVGPPTVCEDDTLSLTADPGFISYLWSTGSTVNQTEVDSGGVYTLTVSDTTGCFRTDSIIVTGLAFADPQPVIQPGDSVYLCGGNPITLDAGVGYARYLWSNGDTTQWTSADQSGSYSVTVWNSSGCSESSDPIYADSVPNPVPVVIRVGDTLTCTPPWATYQWYFAGILLGGETNPSYVATQNGQFVCVITDDFGCTGADTVDFTVGIESLTGFMGFDLYPNPSGGLFYLRTYQPIEEAVTVSIIDMHGRPLNTLAFDRFESVLSFDFQDLAAGIYVLRLQSEGKTWQRRFMIE